MAKKTIKPAPVPKKDNSMPKDMNIEVRPITNGFIIRTSGFKGNEYVSKEAFSKTNPIPQNIVNDIKIDIKKK